MENKIKQILNFENTKIDAGMQTNSQVEGLVRGLTTVIENQIEGDLVELGCFVGESSKYLRKTLDVFNSDKKLFVYDSFEGLPDLSKWEEGTPWKPRTLKTSEEVLVRNFEVNGLNRPDKIVKGWFKDIKEEDLPEKVSFAFFDGDFYDSIYDSLVKVYDRVSEGGYIFFHDYQRPDLPGVDQAIKDFLNERGEEYWVYSVTNQLGLLIKGHNKIKPKKKIGFLHIPRTGGTHLERVLNEMGPEKFINFFGNGAAPNQASNGIPIIETMKKGDNKHQQLLNNPNYKTCELFAGHFSHKIEECFDEEVEFFTILRDPIQRVTSMTKKFTSSRVYREILMDGSEKIGDDIFWKNTENYLNNNMTDGLLTHEVHGFSNYMTKVIAGCDTSDPTIVVNDDIYQKAISNLKKMRYVGFFEEYKKTIDDVLTIFNMDVTYDAGPLKKSVIPETTKNLFTKLNEYDIKLYEYALKLRDEKEKNITYVTALLNINRDTLEGNQFKRDFKTYLDKLEVLLRNLQNKNLVIYIEEENYKFVKDIKQHRVILKPITQDMIRNTEYYDKIQKIRTNPEWSGQNNWLPNSPQAKLELYNPLIFQKIHLLEEVSSKNPFNNDYFVWVDAGIANAQAAPGVFREDWFENNIYTDLDKFLFINYPYNNFNEIHGFKKEGLMKYVSDEINTVTRATFFGGKKDYIKFLSQKFREISHDSLDNGYLGTEESIFTILTYLYPNKINSRMINNTGLVRNYFENLKNMNSSNNTEQVTKDYLPEPYKGLRNQQNPKAFDAFTKFFNEHTDIDLIIEIGAGMGGFTLFLKEQSDKINSRFITYDISEDKCNQIKKLIDGIDIRCKDVNDVFTLNEIEIEISKSKKTLILCDGGDSAKDISEITPLMKKGDIIMGHDYAPNKDIFNEKYKGKIWDWLELTDKDIENTVNQYKLVDVNVELNNVAWVSKMKTIEKQVKEVKDLSKLKTNLYMLTFNFPEQVLHTINSMKKTPEWLEKPNLYLLDNSTDENAKLRNREIASSYNFEYIDLGGNTGICGGRQAAAEHFDKSDADFMFFFEDDMTVNPPELKGEVCRNGFRKYIPNIYNLVHKIMLKDGFDFLKLSFTEVYFDNDKQCSWYNVPQEIRTRDWPHYDKLPTRGLDPNVPLTNFKNIRNMEGLTYIDGEVYYANWPMIVSKEGNRKMFIETKWAHPFEQTWMSNMYQKTKRGELNPAILLASPIWHERIKHYRPEERREN